MHQQSLASIGFQIGVLTAKTFSVWTISAEQHKSPRPPLTPSNLTEQDRVGINLLETLITLAGDKIILDGVILFIAALPHPKLTDVVIL